MLRGTNSILYLVVFLGIVCFGSSGCGDGEESTSPTGQEQEQSTEKRVVMEPEKPPEMASWKDVGRRFKDLEKERQEMIQAMKGKAK